MIVPPIYFCWCNWNARHCCLDTLASIYISVMDPLPCICISARPGFLIQWRWKFFARSAYTCSSALILDPRLQLRVQNWQYVWPELMRSHFLIFNFYIFWVRDFRRRLFFPSSIRYWVIHFLPSLLLHPNLIIRIWLCFVHQGRRNNVRTHSSLIFDRDIAS